MALTTIDDRVVRINQSFTRIFGYSAQAAAGRTLAELIVPADLRDEYRAHLGLLARGERVNAETTRCRQDGSRFPAAILKVPFSSPGQDVAVYTIYRDITECRRAEDARFASEGRWRAIFDNSAMGIALADGHGKLFAVNRAYQEMFGYSEGELRTMSFMDLTSEEDSPANRELVADLWAGRRSQFQLEKRMRRKDGQSIWVRITVSTIAGAGVVPTVAMGIAEDITGRKLALDRLLEYEEVVEGLEEMILVVDRDYRYVMANQAFLHNRGLQREQVVGHLVPELVGDETFERITRRKLDECFQGKAVNYEMQFTFPHLGKRELFGSYFPIRGAAGFDRVAVVLTDVTERKQAERELQRSLLELQALNAQLQSVREEERTRLSREIHDEVGQSLTAIRIDLAALKAAPRGQHPQRIDALMALVDETIRFVRRISAELRPGILDHLGLVAAVEWAAEEFQTRTGIDCQVTLPKTNPDLDTECATALFRILQETLTNIARHAGATIARIVLACENADVTLEVHDNGRGIQHDQLSASNSLGVLGMRERAQILGGDFQISGQPGNGTTVRVRIPCLSRPLPEAGR